LSFLNHPGYREFRLNRTTLSQLPEDGDVLEQLAIHTVGGLDGIPADSGPAMEEGMVLQDSELARKT
jgi:ATP-dependent DNA helicase PIF1